MDKKESKQRKGSAEPRPTRTPSSSEGHVQISERELAQEGAEKTGLTGGVLGRGESSAGEREQSTAAEERGAETAETSEAGTVTNIRESSVQILQQEVHHHHHYHRIPPDERPEATLPSSATPALPSTEIPTPGPSAQGAVGGASSTTTVDPGSLSTEVEERDSHGVTTTFRNLHGGSMSISKSVEREIGQEEMLVKLAECYVKFPLQAFPERSAKVSLVAEIDSSKWRGQFVGHTPTLYIDAPGLQKEIEIQLPSWSIGDSRSTARLWHRPKGKIEWEPTELSMLITDEPFFKFKWKNFCPIAVGTEPGPSHHENPEILVAGGVYTSEMNDLSAEFHIDDRGGSGQHAMAAEWVAKAIAELTPQRLLRHRLRPLEMRSGKDLKLKISCDPDTLHPLLPDPFITTVDRTFIRIGYDIHNTTIVGDEKKSLNISVICELYKDGDRCKPDAFGCPWTPGNNERHERQELSQGRGSVLTIDNPAERNQRTARVEGQFHQEERPADPDTVDEETDGNRRNRHGAGTWV